MNDFLTNYGLFLAETVTSLVVILVGVAGVVAIGSKNKGKSQEKIEVTNINEKYEKIRDVMRQTVCDQAEIKEFKKQEKIKVKNEKLADKRRLAAIAKAAKEKKKEKGSAKKHPESHEKHVEHGMLKAHLSMTAVTATAKICKTGQASHEEVPHAVNTNMDNEVGKTKRRVFVINFDGDIRALTVENLRQEISAVLTIATPRDEVLVKIESAGGVIHGYGLAASQLQRIRNRNIPLTVVVDKIAASGGYMMACVANRILAAPFAIIGSIGVITQLPNFNRFLKRHNIDFEQVSAGEYKRTLTMFGENTDKGRKKLQEEVEEAHELFKSFVIANRPIVDIHAIATGEHWLGTRAKELKLVDEIMTSDDYLMLACDEADLYEITYTTKKNLLEKLTSSVSKAVAQVAT